MDSTLEDICDIRRMGDSITSRIDATNAIIAKFDAEYWELDKVNEALLKDIDRMKYEGAILDRDIELLQAHTRSQSEQITLLEETVRPQLLNEVKRSKEEVKMTRKKYDALIDKYEKIWEEYEKKYNQFPRVAEKNALEIKVKLLQIEVMKKNQEVLEKRNQLNLLRETQARQSEILRNEFFVMYSEEQEARKKYEAIQKEIREIKEGIALKKAKKQEEQQKLEEERKRKLKEDELRQLASKTSKEKSNSKGTESTQGENSTLSSKIFRIPTFSIPKFEDLFVMISSEAAASPKPFKSLSQGTALEKSLPVIKNNAQNANSQNISMSQPAKISVMQTNTVPSLTPSLEKHPETSNTSLKIQRKGVKSKESASPHLFVRNEEKKDTSDMNSNLCLGSFENELYEIPSASKKEFMISTDNMVAKIKCAARNNNTMPPASSGVQFDRTKYPVKSPNDQSLCDKNEVLMPQRPSTDQEVIQPRCYIEPMETDQREDDVNVKQTDHEASKIAGNEKNNDSNELTSSSIDLFAGSNDENVNQLPDDQAYGFNPDFGEEMLSSLGSPPLFDGNVMSPVHAAFDASPTLSMDDDPKNGDTNQRTFTGFGFFPTKTNIFGGPPSSGSTENETAKSASSFSFLF